MDSIEFQVCNRVKFSDVLVPKGFILEAFLTTLFFNFFRIPENLTSPLQNFRTILLERNVMTSCRIFDFFA